MSKWCYDPFKIHEKTSNCVVTCYHKTCSTVSLQCLTRKREETVCPVPKENHANARESAS